MEVTLVFTLVREDEGLEQVTNGGAGQVQRNFTDGGILDRGRIHHLYNNCNYFLQLLFGPLKYRGILATQICP